MHESIIDVLSIVEATFNFDNIKIFIDEDEDEEIFANENEFSQVVFSILNNARDIFNQREIKNPEIHIKISNRKITFSDNGGGIEKDIIDKIFLPDVSTTNGTGVGLYLSKNIVEKNRGLISATNSDNGAVFCLEFLTWID